jgi:hypothetical protein
MKSIKSWDKSAKVESPFQPVSGKMHPKDMFPKGAAP